MKSLRHIITDPEEFERVETMVAAAPQNALVATSLAGRFVVVVLKTDGEAAGWLLAPGATEADAQAIGTALIEVLQSRFPAVRAALDALRRSSLH